MKRTVLTKIVGWLFGVTGAIVAGVIVFWITSSNPSSPSPDPPPGDPCQPLPRYLSELSIVPPSFPGATVPITIEFAASGPDPHGKIREYEWSYEGRSKRGKRVQFTLENRGANIVSLRATDVDGCTVHRERRILAR